MFLFILDVILCFIVAKLAKTKGRSGIAFFFLSAFFTPIIGLIILLVIGEEAEKISYNTYQPKNNLEEKKYYHHEIVAEPTAIKVGVTANEFSERMSESNNNLSDFVFLKNNCTVLIGMSEKGESKETIVLPYYVTAVQSEAFSRCASLKALDLYNVNSIGEGAFRNCINLTDIYVNRRIDGLFEGTCLPKGCEIHVGRLKVYNDSYIKVHNNPAKEDMIQTIKADSSYVNSLEDMFFAVDVETTGLSPAKDRIIEIAAVKFENNIAVSSFSTLVASVNHIPVAAMRINGITDDQLETEGIDEIDAFNQFIDFLGPNTLSGNVCLVAHNAAFDMSFIKNTLKRLYSDIDVTLRYFDTLTLSKKYLDLENYKQQTVADYYGIENDNIHRAESDAETCGEILIHLMDKMKDDTLQDPWESIQDESVKSSIVYNQIPPTEEEREICAYIKKVLIDAGKDTSRLRFAKTSSGNIKVKYPYGFADFKVLKTKPTYINIGKNMRVDIENPQQIELLTDFLVEEYEKDGKSIKRFYGNKRWVQIEYLSSFQIDDNEVDHLVEECIKRADAKAKNKAILEAEKIAKQKEKEERRLTRQICSEKENENTETKSKSIKRRIGRYDDNMVLLEEYESVASASASVGISTKSIRDSATGRQKHAAGYIWRYMDTNE